MVEFVCEDRNSSWYYDPKNETYLRFYDGQNKAGRKIKGQDLPDPERVYEMRIKAGHPSPNVTPAVRSLWQHWQLVKNS